MSARRCVVTGASRGIGRETARLLLEGGADVLLVARGEAELTATAAELSSLGQAEHLALDITADDAGDRMLAAASDRFGGVDVLVNNAGASRWREVDEIPDEDWRAQFEINVMAPMRAMRAMAPPMAERGWGRIVNVCSSTGKFPSQATPEYSVAKAAELSLSRLFADKYAPAGVCINAVCPGAVESEMWMRPGGLLDQLTERSGATSRAEALAAVGAKRPIGRLGTSMEIATTVAFLCSDLASFVVGSAWSVDGGSNQMIV